LTIASPDSIYGDAFLIRALDDSPISGNSDKWAVFARPEAERKN
jgi:hypothetical protein